jgi:hypothetical protein
MELAWAVLSFRYELDRASETRARDMLAVTILALANNGEQDPKALCEGALRHASSVGSFTTRDGAAQYDLHPGEDDEPAFANRT